MYACINWPEYNEGHVHVYQIWVTRLGQTTDKFNDAHYGKLQGSKLMVILFNLGPTQINFVSDLGAN